jgi:hypothetical protein
LQQVEFSIANGSALIKRLRQLGLTWIPQNLTWQIILTSLIAWLPLLIFSARQGLAFGNKVEIPFLYDLIEYARFLVALPCMIALGKFIDPRLQGVLNSFMKSGIVRSKDFTRFENAISRTSAVASSIGAELVILVLVYTYMSLRLYRDVSGGITSWHHPHSGAAIHETAANWWFLWVSMPLLLFSAFIWVWRLGLWAYLLFRISRLQLRVVATHPDGAGGLSFIQVGMRRFSVLVFAISSILCASIGVEILFNGASLRSYELELVTFFLVCIVVVLGPLMIFTPILIRSKLEYWGKYSPLASSYVQRFDEKWTSQAGHSREDLLGNPDFQSLADLRHGYSGIAEMRTWLPNRGTVSIFAIAYVVPILPLLASVISLRQVLSEVYSLLLK